MKNILELDIFDSIANIIGNMGSFLKFEYLLYIAIGLQLLFIIYFIIRTNFTYELRLLRSIDRLNLYLLKNQFINESNLVDFNKKIKKSPKILRYHWQQYMLYREKDPSYYMSTYNCIEKPAKSSVFKEKIKNFISITCLLALVSLIIGFGYCKNYFIVNGGSGSVAGTTSVLYIILECFIIPSILFIIGILFVMYLRTRLNFVVSDLYQNFQVFERLIDKASSTIPEYVDYEVLFTKKEIKKGIPVLNEYLEKRVRQEQAELEKARQNAIQSEKYDFSNFNIDGSLVLERAMKESELYLNIKNRLTNECNQIENEIENSKKSFEIKQKEFERKLQVSRENLDRLKAQQESSTNRIESNYIRKQQADEVKKQQSIEKDLQDAQNRYNQEISALNQEIENRKKEIEERRKFVETAMSSEFKNFSIKVYKEVDDKIDEEKENEKAKLVAELAKYKKDLKDRAEEEYKLNKALLEKTEEIGKLKAELGIINSTELDKQLKNQVSKNLNLTNKQETIKEVKDEPANQTEEEPELTGYYNDEGYYIYNNGTFYDPEGNYWDLKGGYYDEEGNYHLKEQTFFPDKDNTDNAAEENKEKITVSNENQDNEIAIENTSEETVPVIETENSELHEEQIEDKEAELQKQDETEEQTEEQTVEQDEDLEQLEQEDELEPEETEEVQDKQKSTRGRKKGSKNKTKKGKRGRPSKSRVIFEPQLNKEVKRRGRPRKQVSEENEAPVVKRGRGRPRKEKTEEEPITTVKRGRGRPKKVIQEAIEHIDELNNIQKQIDDENSNLNQKREELKSKLEETLKKLQEEE